MSDIDDRDTMLERFHSITTLTDPDAAYAFLDPGEDELRIAFNDATDLAALFTMAKQLPEIIFDHLVEVLGSHKAVHKFLCDYTTDVMAAHDLDGCEDGYAAKADPACSATAGSCLFRD